MSERQPKNLAAGIHANNNAEELTLTLQLGTVEKRQLADDLLHSVTTGQADQSLPQKNETYKCTINTDVEQ